MRIKLAENADSIAAVFGVRTCKDEMSLRERSLRLVKMEFFLVGGGGLKMRRYCLMKKNC